jgi:hypothetical protein
MATSRDKFFLYQVCPPGRKIKYFFSNPCLGIFTHAYNQKTIETDINEPMRNEKLCLNYGKKCFFVLFFNFLEDHSRLIGCI